MKNIKCELCSEPTKQKAMVINGMFIKNICSNCIMKHSRQASALSASYSRDRQREESERDMLQPRLPNGQINKEFLKEYPEESREFFTDEQIRNA